MSDKIILTKQQVELIQELAHVHETMGLQPAMAKIMALLTVSDDVELTFDQIKDTLELSKSAISQALSQLLLIKRINYKTRIGDRKRYFHVMITDWQSHVREQFSGIGMLVAVNRKIVSKRSSKNKEFNRNLEEMTDFLAFIHEQAPGLYRQYKGKKK